MVSNDNKKGILLALGSYVLWGVMPIYWQAMHPIDSFVIIFYRIVLVAVVSFLCALKTDGFEKIKDAIRPKKRIVIFVFAGIFITINWSVYVWAVNANYVIQTSIGHYIEPLMIAIFGIILFKERLTKYKFMAFVLAAIGVLIIIIHCREVPFLAIGLGSSFAVYAAIKKLVKCSSMISLFYETIFLAPIALVFVLYLELTRQGALQVANLPKYFLLLSAGVVTVLVLWLFSESETKTSMTNIGLIAFVAPTISLLMGIFLFKEPFDVVNLIGFIVIWIGLLCFVLEGIINHKI